MNNGLVHSDLLSTWKEIAHYLGRGVRTAQRWERHGLPVRRVTPGPRASVIADRCEIDVWLKRSDPGVRLPGNGLSDFRQSVRTFRELRSDMCSLRLELTVQRLKLHENVEALRKIRSEI